MRSHTHKTHTEELGGERAQMQADASQLRAGVRSLEARVQVRTDTYFETVTAMRAFRNCC